MNFNKIQAIFNQFKDHIIYGEINEIKELAQTLARELGEDAVWLPIITDKDGNNLLHLAISTGDRSIVRTLCEETGKVNSKIDWMSICSYMENKDGKKPVDCVPEKPQQENFESIIERNFTPQQPPVQFDQKSIIKQFQRYLISNTIKNPEEYNIEDVVNIINDINEGMCLGLSGLWAQSILNGQPGMYFEMIDKIMNCKDFSIDMDPKLQQHFEYVIQLVRSFLLLGKDINEARSKNSVSNDNSFHAQAKDLPEQKQKDLVGIWGKEESLQNEYYLSYSPGSGHFGDFFTNFANQQNDGKLMMIDGQLHSTACYFKDNKFYFFDSNKEIQGSDNSISYTAIVDVNIDPKYDITLGNIIQNALYPNGVDPWWDDITFRVADRAGNIPGSYPSKEILENMKVQTHTTDSILTKY